MGSQPDVVQLEGQEERERDRADPDQASDRALDEAQDEEAEQIDDNEDIEHVDLAKGVGDVHANPRDGGLTALEPNSAEG